jgi:hypothetical protein
MGHTRKFTKQHANTRTKRQRGGGILADIWNFLFSWLNNPTENRPSLSAENEEPAEIEEPVKKEPEPDKKRDSIMEFLNQQQQNSNKYANIIGLDDQLYRTGGKSRRRVRQKKRHNV